MCIEGFYLVVLLCRQSSTPYKKSRQGGAVGDVTHRVILSASHSSERSIFYRSSCRRTDPPIDPPTHLPPLFFVEFRKVGKEP